MSGVLDAEEHADANAKLHHIQCNFMQVAIVSCGDVHHDDLHQLSSSGRILQKRSAYQLGQIEKTHQLYP